jgi:hypothetical protein
MALITLDEFKTYLQITDSSYDAGYAAFIEAVSDDVENMANQFFDLEYVVNTTASSQFLSTSVELYDLFEGITVTGAGIPDRAILQDTSLYQVTMNKYATANATGITATFNAVPEQIKPVIAQMVLYKITNNTASAGGSVKDVKSRSMGPVSVTFGTGAAIDSTYGYPKNLVKSIKKIRRLALDTGEIRRSGMDITNRERMVTYGKQ